MHLGTPKSGHSVYCMWITGRDSSAKGHNKNRTNDKNNSCIYITEHYSTTQQLNRPEILLQRFTRNRKEGAKKRTSSNESMKRTGVRVGECELAHDVVLVVDLVVQRHGEVLERLHLLGVCRVIFFTSARIQRIHI